MSFTLCVEYIEKGRGYRTKNHTGTQSFIAHYPIRWYKKMLDTFNKFLLVSSKPEMSKVLNQ